MLFDSSQDNDAELVGVARELAAKSRMSTISRVGQDAEVRAVLLDLELLLLQIARLVDGQDTSETQIVREKAVLWIGGSDDPRAAEFLMELLEP